MPRIGLEPTHLTAPEPKSGVSTNFTTWAKQKQFIFNSCFSQDRGMKTDEIKTFLLRSYPWRPEQTAMIESRLPAILDQLSFNAGNKGNIEEEVRNLIAGIGQDLELPETKNFPPAVQAIYSSLFTDLPVAFDPKEILSFAFVEQDPFLLKKMRELLQLTLLKIYEQLGDYHLSHELFIGHVLSYLPFFGVEEGELFEIPIHYKNKWHLAKYKAHKIYLTPHALGSRIVSIGLSTDEAPDLLLFKGTSYPSDEGFALSVLTDINPGYSVGGLAFRFGKKNIAKWLQSRQVKVFGLSLGGALALHTAKEFPDHIDSVFAFNPPALLPWELKQSQAQPQVHVVYHENDIIPLTGFKWGNGWNLYRIYLNKKMNFMRSHFKCFVARKNHIILRSNPLRDEQKRERKFLASLHFVLSFFLFPIAGLIHFCCSNILQLFKRS